VRNPRVTLHPACPGRELQGGGARGQGVRFRLKCRVYGFQLPSFALTCRGSFRVRGFGVRFRVSGFGFSSFEFRAVVTSRVSGFGCRVVGLYSTGLATRGGFRVDVTSRVQGFGSRVSGFRFRGLG